MFRLFAFAEASQKTVIALGDGLSKIALSPFFKGYDTSNVKAMASFLWGCQ